MHAPGAQTSGFSLLRLLVGGIIAGTLGISAVTVLWRFLPEFSPPVPQRSEPVPIAVPLSKSTGAKLYESAFPMAKNNDWRGFGVEVTKTSMIFPYQGIVRPVYRMLPESGTFAVFCVYADGRKILTDVQANFDGHTGYLCPELKDVTPSHQIFVRKTEKMVFGYYSYVEVQN